MTPQMTRAISLRIKNHKSYSQIGLIMGLSKWQVRDLVQLARQYLRGYAAGYREAMRRKEAK